MFRNIKHLSQHVIRHTPIDFFFCALALRQVSRGHSCCGDLHSACRDYLTKEFRLLAHDTATVSGEQLHAEATADQRNRKRLFRQDEPHPHPLSRHLGELLSSSSAWEGYATLNAHVVGVCLQG
jgi:hypothetical protein